MLLMRGLRNVAGGARWGFVIGSLLAVWAAIVAAVSGSAVVRARSGDAYHIAAIVAVNVLGGTVTGGIVGALLPLMRWRAGAAVVGMIASLPLAAALASTRLGFAGWTRNEFLTVLIFALTVGCGGGVIVRAFLVEEGHLLGKHRD
jgi:hypothetical protein